MSSEMNVTTELEAIRTRYSNSTKQKKYNFLVYGNMGSGKSYSLRTARKPILIHSFDPGGTKGLREYIEAGDVLVDERWEISETVSNPTIYRDWSAEITRLANGGFFNTVGTFVIDSLSTFMDALSWNIASKKGRTEGLLAIQDYSVLWNTLKTVISQCACLPCDFIMTGHIAEDKDEVTGRKSTSVNVPGQAKTKLFTLFDEVYTAISTETSKGIEYKFLTANNGVYQARTRLGVGKFSTYEPQDFTALLKKGGVL